ncbi:MAG: hypothetical protein ACE5GW_09805, partial [Planctomycetota bacterium]
DFATTALEEAARDILDGIEGRRARVEALYNAVCERVKTPGAGTTPAEIWLEKSGDRDLLLAGLLRAAGIPFQRVMAADKDALQPHVDWEQPNPSLFHFPLFRVPLEGEEQLFITTRYRLASPGRIPLSIQGARGVLAGMAAGRWLQLPSAPPEDESQALEATIDLDQADGGVHLVGRVETRRLQGSLMKEQVRSLNPFVRTTMVERFVQEIFPGARIRSGDFPDLDARGTPFLFTFDIDAPGLLQVEEGSPTLRSILTPAHLVRAFVRGASRTYPMQSRAESLVTERNVIRLGEAYQVEQLPADLLLDGPWGSYRLTFRGAGGEITIERRLELRPFRAEPEALGDLIDFCTRIDRKEEERIRLRRTGNDGGE